GALAAAESSVQLRAQPGFRIWILRQQPPSPGKRTGGRFGAGQKKRDRFITKLSVRHSRTVFILCGQQHRKQVPGVTAGGAALADDSVKNILDLRHFTLYTQIRRRGQPVRNKYRSSEIRTDFQQQFE